MATQKSMFRRVDAPAPEPPDTNLVLVVAMTAEKFRAVKAGADCTSSDEFRDEVCSFLDEHDLPNPDPFASIAVFVGEPPASSEWRGYGTVIGYLSPEAIDHLELVATDDVQDAALNGHPERVKAVAGARAERERIVRTAVANVAAGKYVEARSGPLPAALFERFDTSGDFELSLEEGLDDSGDACT